MIARVGQRAWGTPWMKCRGRSRYGTLPSADREFKRGGPLKTGPYYCCLCSGFHIERPSDAR